MSLRRVVAAVSAIVMLSAAVVAAPAAAAQTSLAPTSLATTTGKTTGGVAQLASVDGSYLTVSPRGSNKYNGYRTYRVPTAVEPSLVTGITVNVEYRGKAQPRQKFTWSLYNWSAKKWATVGTNATAVAGTWTSLQFATSNASRFVAPAGSVRVRVTASTATYSAAIDYESITVEHNEAESVVLPPANGKFDYQLGGAYTPEPGVSIVSRDRLETPIDGLYNICYVNLMQTQPDQPGQSKTSPPYGTTAWWKKHHSSLLLKNSAGTVIVDKNWNEALFDVRTAAKRSALLAVQKSWITGCAEDGFDAVEPDNLDSHLRSKGLMNAAQGRAYLATVIPFAHARGLAIAQKNASDIYHAAGPRLGFDFAIAEECERYTECAAYGAYGDLLFEIEYTDENPSVKRGNVTKTTFEWACSDRGDVHSIMLRDRDVVPAGGGGYVYRSC